MFSIRWKLVLSYVLLSAVTAVAMGVISFTLIRGFVNRQAKEQLEETAERIGEELQPYINDRDLTEMRNLAAALGLINNLRIRVLDGRERLLADTHTMTDSYRNQIAENLERWGMGRMVFPRLIAGRETRMTPPRPGEMPPARELRIPVLQDDGVIGYIELENPPDLADRTLRASVTYFGIAGATALIAAVLIGLFMGGRLTSPIRRLTRTMETMQSGDLSIRSDVARNDEIGTLAAGVNAMADTIETHVSELEQERDSLKAFVADASHELRTPVTALRTFHELLSGNAGDDPARRREFLADSASQLERLQWIVQSLLTLTRFDSEVASLTPELLPIRDLVDEALTALEPDIAARRLTVDVHALETNASISCDRQSMVTAITNVIHNAITYSPDGGTIHIAGEQHPLESELVIADSGPGIATDEIPLVTNRFYRSPVSKGPGSGLGLALTESILRAHHGHLTIQSPWKDGHGTGCILVVPVSETDPTT